MAHRFISIVIPCLNEARITEERLSALQPLREAGHELVVVDGGSTDGTPVIAFPLVDRLVTSPAGRAIQMNRGVRCARHGVLWFLHMDSEPPRRGAEAVLAAALDGPGWGRFDVHLAGRSPMFRVIERMMNLRSRVSGIATGDQGVFVSRGLFEAAGGFPEIPLMEDIALSKRLKAIARPACLRSRITTSSRRWERHGILRTILTMWLLRAAYQLGVDPAALARVYYPRHRQGEQGGEQGE
jgi:rSAM/selenodomain-associated transferase 2